MQQLLLFISRPLRLLDAGIEPLVPPCLALFGRFSIQERSNSSPLVLAVLHDGGLEDLVLLFGPFSLVSAQFLYEQPSLMTFLGIFCGYNFGNLFPILVSKFFDELGVFDHVGE